MGVGAGLAPMLWRKLMTKALLGAAFLGLTFAAPTSGLNVGDMVTPFHPKHVSGPHKGTDACPP